MNDDTLKYVLHATDGRGDFISLPRKFIEGCVMTSEKFEEVYYEFTHDRRYADAYRQAEDLHVKLFGVQRYSSYESFKVQLSKKHGSHNKTIFDE